MLRVVSSSCTAPYTGDLQPARIASVRNPIFPGVPGRDGDWVAGVNRMNDIASVSMVDFDTRTAVSGITAATSDDITTFEAETQVSYGTGMGSEGMTAVPVEGIP